MRGVAVWSRRKGQARLIDTAPRRGQAGGPGCQKAAAAQCSQRQTMLPQQGQAPGQWGWERQP
eukprot:4766168-Pleurochrysis_carterae.AAC.1